MTARDRGLVGEALAGLRDDVFLVSKVYPHHASRRGVVAACDASLKRLRTDRLDLYLLHWRGSVPLETVEGFEALQRAGKIRHWGVSNFDTADMAELVDEAGGGACATNQILYNIARRGGVRPAAVACRAPDAGDGLQSGRSRAAAEHSPLDEIARQRGVSVMRVALAWSARAAGGVRDPEGIATRTCATTGPRSISCSAMTSARSDAYFRPPRSKRALEML